MGPKMNKQYKIWDSDRAKWLYGSPSGIIEVSPRGRLFTPFYLDEKPKPTVRRSIVCPRIETILNPRNKK
jgi:hypothetical protein